MKPTEPDFVKLFIGLLYSNEELLEKAIISLKKNFGEVDYLSQVFDFNISNYYEEEMGRPIYRKFISFINLINPGELATIKIETNKIEDLLIEGGKRKVNLDPGYIDFNKVILASAKYNGQKIYLDKGIYADPTLLYDNKKFSAYPSSFPDFKAGLYNETFVKIRHLYKAEMKKGD